MFLLGSAYPTAKVGINASMPPILFAAIRMLIVFICLLPFLKFKLPKLDEVDILGPVDTPIFKLKKNYRSRILIRYPQNLFIQKYFSSLIKNLKFPQGIKLGVDVDPINFS